MSSHEGMSSQYPMSNSGFWHNLFSPAGFMPRQSCGIWTKGEIYLHNASDFLIWAAYLTIPIVLLYFVFRRREGLPFRNLFLLFGMFIVSCGTTHFMEIVMFYYPIYRIAGLLKFFTAVISWATVVALAPAIPRALSMRSPDALESEVLARTQELQVLNAQKDELLRSEQEARREVEALHREAESARREAERLRAEAEGNNRAKDEFLMTLSHELRTPLNTIQGWSSLIRTGKLDEETQAQALETIERSCQTQTRLVDDILEVSRIITGKMVIESSPLQVAPVVQAAFLSAEPAARAKGLQFSLDIEDPAALVLGDGARLQQIVWNLLSNAIKFTPKGGQVKVTLRRVDSMSQIEVRDSGEGIAPEFLPHVFDRFRQADSSMTRQHGGLGLGLSIVRHLVEMHGGLVSVESEGLGKGTAFFVSLPLRAVADVDFQGDSSPITSDGEGELKGLRILVVDDEAEARGLVGTILRMHGAQTRLAGSAAEGWEQLEAWRPDVLVSDIGMPRENGYQLLERVRHTESGFQRIPSLALTAYVSANDRERAKNAGFDAHLSKPVMPDTLLREVGQLAGRLRQEQTEANKN